MDNKWQILSAGLELNIIIAKALGYTARRGMFTINPHYNPSEHEGVAIFDPSNERLTHWNSYPDHKEAEIIQWRQAFSPSSYEYDDAPIRNYSLSVDAALILIGDYKMTLSQRAGRWSAVVADGRLIKSISTPALAICYAWLDYMENKK